MSSYMRVWCAQNAVLAPPHSAERRRAKTKMTVRLIDLLRPDSYWPHPLSIEQAFGVFQWMVRTGAEFSAWGRSGVYDLIQCKPTCIGADGAGPVVSIDDLRRRFHFAILSDHASDLARQWRSAAGVAVDSEPTIDFRHDAPFKIGPLGSEQAIKEALRLFFLSTSEGELAVSFNSIHSKARCSQGGSIHVRPNCFAFKLGFGYGDGSSWDVLLAETRDRETFVDTLRRALWTLALIRGEVVEDPAKLCRALNEEAIPPRMSHYSDCRTGWILSPDGPVESFNAAEPGARLVIDGSTGGLPKGIHVVHLPAGRPIFHHDAYDWHVVKAAVAKVVAEHGQPADTEEDGDRFGALISDALANRKAA